MEEVKSGTVKYHSDDFYKSMGIPAPDQYRAFIELYKIVDDYNFFAKSTKTLTNHARLPLYPGTIKLLKGINDNFKKNPVNSVTIACGSFYKNNLWVRYEIINYLNQLCDKGVVINLYTNCNANEEGINKLNKNINFEFLNKRVMIHFIMVDDKYIKIHFPHSEKILQRLSMLIEPKDFLNSPLKEKKTELFKFFNNLIERAKEKN